MDDIIILWDFSIFYEKALSQTCLFELSVSVSLLGVGITILMGSVFHFRKSRTSGLCQQSCGSTCRIWSEKFVCSNQPVD